MNAQATAHGHERVETSNLLMIILTLLAVAIGGVVEIVPLFFQRSTTEPLPGVKPYTALQLTGRDIYIREGCYNCHSQMIRTLSAETLRYGHYSMAGEFVYDTRSSGAASAPAPTSRASAASTPTSGTAST